MVWEMSLSLVGMAHQGWFRPGDKLSIRFVRKSYPSLFNGFLIDTQTGRGEVIVIAQAYSFE